MRYGLRKNKGREILRRPLLLAPLSFTQGSRENVLRSIAVSRKWPAAPGSMDLFHFALNITLERIPDLKLKER